MGKFEASFIFLEDDLYYFWIKFKILCFLKFSDFIKIKFIFFQLFMLLFTKCLFNFRLRCFFMYRNIYMYMCMCVCIYIYRYDLVMYKYESWTIKKAECQRIDAFELWCWRRLLRVPWTARRSYQPVLKEISPEYSLERLKLKLQYFGHLMRRTDSLEKTLMLGKIEGRRRRG